MILTPNIVSKEHITFTYLSVYNLTTNSTLQLKVERLNLLGEPVPEEGANEGPNLYHHGWKTVQSSVTMAYHSHQLLKQL